MRAQRLLRHAGRERLKKPDDGRQTTRGGEIAQGSLHHSSSPESRSTAAGSSISPGRGIRRRTPRSRAAVAARAAGSFQS